MGAPSHEQDVEIGICYLRGMTIEETHKATGASHGTIVNRIKELVAGHLAIPGVPSDEVADLRKLSIYLKKKGLDPSKAMMGIASFERSLELGIEPGMMEKWAKLVKVFSPDNFPAKHFFESAMNLHQLEKAEGQPFGVLVEKYSELTQQSVELKAGIEAQIQQQDSLSQNLHTLGLEMSSLETKKKEMDALIELKSTKLAEADAAMAATGEKLAQAEKDIEALEKEKANLGAAVDGKEKLMKTLEGLNFSENDLLHLKDALEGMSKKVGANPEQVKDQFFSALNRYGDLAGLEKATQEQVKVFEDGSKKNSELAGHIMGLENQKAVLEGEVSQSAAAGAEQIRAASEEAVSVIHEEVEEFRKKFKPLLEEVVAAGIAVGEMRASQKSGEQSGKELEEIVGEVQRRIGLAQ